MPDKVDTVRDWYEKSYTEGGSDAYRHRGSAQMLDPSTLNGIFDKG